MTATVLRDTFAMLPRVQRRMAFARACDLSVATVWRKMILPDGAPVDRTARDYMRAA